MYGYRRAAKSVAAERLHAGGANSGNRRAVATEHAFLWAAAVISQRSVFAEATDGTSAVHCSVYYLPVIVLDPRCGESDQVGALA